MPANNPQRRTPLSRRTAFRKQALTFAIAAALAGVALTAPPAQAVGSLANVEIIARGDSRPLPAVWGQDRYWVVGTPRPVSYTHLSRPRECSTADSSVMQCRPGGAPACP